ncbi:hypothetical protein [Veillonella sp.]|uniref:hypothetical protein n=1 Tax=Veillonella sp. TaxID=1926307 RepID=UPI00280AD4F1|nr:hypothetical protein [uncultured Veillonella sp.]
MSNASGENVTLPIKANVLAGFGNDIGSGVKAIGIERLGTGIKVYARDVTNNGTLAAAYLRWIVFCTT